MIKTDTDAVVLHLGTYEAMQLGWGIEKIDPLCRAAMILGLPGTFTLIFTPEED